MKYLFVAIPIWALYMVLTANPEPSNWVVGFLIALAAAWLFQPQGERVAPRRIPGALAALGRYIIILVIDLLMSGIQVARIVLDPALPIKPGIVAIPSGCQSEKSVALSAHAITVTPGELVVEIDEQGVMYTHCLDATRAAEYAEDAQQMRADLLGKIFE